MKSKISRFLKTEFNNLDTFFVVFLILLVNFDLIFTILNKSNLTSLCFKTSFVVIAIFLVYKIVQTFWNSKTFTKFFKTDFFKYLLVSLIPIIISGVIVLVSFTKQISLNNYLTKYICLIFVFIYLVLLITGKYNKALPRISVFISIVVGLLFCLATIIPYLRNRQFTGSFSYNFSNPNAASLAICFTICNLIYGIFIFRSTISKILIGAEVCWLFVGLYYTQARNPFVAFIVALIVVAFVLKLAKKSRFVSSTIVVSSILFFACIYVLMIYFISDGKIPDFVNIPSIGKGIVSRYGIWLDAFKLIARNPFVGSYGILNGQFQYHNAILDLFVAYGIPTAIIIASCFIYLLSKTADNFVFISLSQKISMFCFLTCIYTGLFESSIFSSPQGLYILFFSFTIYLKMPLCSDCLAESNAVNFGRQTDKKIDLILINSVYRKGSTGKIVESIKNEAENDGHSVSVLYGRKEIENPEFNVAKCSSSFESIFCRFLNKLTRDYSLFNWFSTFNYIKIINKYKPDVIHIHCLNDYFINQYMLFKFLKRKHIRTVLTLHSENLYVGCQEGHVFNCDNWYNGKKCRHCKTHKASIQNKLTWNRLNRMFVNFDELTITAVSPWLAERAKQSTILNKFDIKTVLNGVNENFVFRDEKSNLLPEELSNKKKILFVCANASNSHKGFNYFKMIAKKFENNESVHFVCLSLETFADENNKNITYLQPIRDNILLSKLYSECNVSLVLSPRETFSMPTAESLSSGTMVAGFKCGGAESIANKSYSFFVEFGDIDGLCLTIEDILRKDVKKNHIANSCLDLYSSKRMYYNFSRIYKLKKKDCLVDIKI